MNISEAQFWSKGGIGIVDKNLYIDVKSNYNELVFADGRRWKGLNIKDKQVVYVIGQLVIVDNGFPESFSLSDCIVISFEQDKVFFYDFRFGTGGYYLRKNP